MKKEYYWFTLVELIVAITIIAILWTIGLLSLSRQNGDARDSIRLNNIKVLSRNLSIKINAEQISDINSVTSIPLIKNTLTSWIVSSGSDITNIWYSVGTPNIVFFWDQDFVDPLSKDHYPIALIHSPLWVYYQVAATSEEKRAMLVWNYYQFIPSDIPGILKGFNNNEIIMNDSSQALPY